MKNSKILYQYIINSRHSVSETKIVLIKVLFALNKNGASLSKSRTIYKRGPKPTRSSYVQLKSNCSVMLTTNAQSIKTHANLCLFETTIVNCAGEPIHES